jgi:hypothetical protein
MPNQVEKRVVMPKTVAKRWVARIAHAEYRFKILLGTQEVKGLPGLLRSFRDRKVAMAGVEPLPDLGVKENFDYIEVWSSNHDGIVKLKDWFERRGFETTGVW